MNLQDQIDAFQKLIFSHFRSGSNNECRISALVPLVTESYGIYKFITSMLRAMHSSTLQITVENQLTGFLLTDLYLQVWATRMPLNPYAFAMTRSTTVWSGFITNVLICVILPV